MNYVIILMDLSTQIPSCIGVYDSIHQDKAFDRLKETLKQLDIYNIEYKKDIYNAENIHELAQVSEKYNRPIRVYINSLNDNREVWPI